MALHTEGLVRLQKMGFCKTFKPPTVAEPLPKIVKEDAVVEVNENLD